MPWWWTPWLIKMWRDSIDPVGGCIKVNRWTESQLPPYLIWVWKISTPKWWTSNGPTISFHHFFRSSCIQNLGTIHFEKTVQIFHSMGVSLHLEQFHGCCPRSLILPSFGERIIGAWRCSTPTHGPTNPSVRWRHPAAAMIAGGGCCFFLDTPGVLIGWYWI